ncbi:MAG: hypothetical protein RLZZ216_1274, partial [Cyanobacteriota bacterium]
MGAEQIRQPRLISCDQTGIAAGGKGRRVAQFSCRLWPSFRCRLTLQILGATAGFGMAGALGLASSRGVRAAGAAPTEARDLELAYMTATEQLQLFRQKKLSPV